MLVLRLVYLVGEVDEELRGAPNGEALHPQSRCGLQASNEALVLCDVVGDLLALLKAELHDVVELVLSGRDEYRPSPRGLMREGAVKIHDPAVRRLASRRGGPVFAYLKCRGNMWCMSNVYYSSKLNLVWTSSTFDVHHMLPPLESNMPAQAI